MWQICVLPVRHSPYSSVRQRVCTPPSKMASTESAPVRMWIVSRRMSMNSAAVTNPEAGKSLCAASSILSTLASDRPFSSIRCFFVTVSRDLTVEKPPSRHFCDEK